LLFVACLALCAYTPHLCYVVFAIIIAGLMLAHKSLLAD
jgi:hypothetical protein